jgi:hypothetical protein
MDEPREPSALSSEVRKRYRVPGVTRGAEINIEIWDEVEKRGVVLTYPEALTVAADINLEIARVFQELVSHLDQMMAPSRSGNARSPRGASRARARKGTTDRARLLLGLGTQPVPDLDCP